MSATREEVVAEARRWINTPVKKYGRVLGRGVDCIGLGEEVGKATGAMDDPHWLDGPWAKYGSMPNPRHLLAALNTYLIRIGDDEWGDGDVAALAWVDARNGVLLPMHMAIMSSDLFGRPNMIHAHARIRRKRVVEHGYTAEWPRRAHSFYRYPKLVV